MGPGFVILFWLILAAGFGVLWLGSLVVFVIGWWRKSRAMSWLGGAPLAGLTLLATLIGTLTAIGIYRGSTPRYVYEDAFGEKPTPDVVGLKSDTWSFADSGHTFLQFQASHGTFQRILPKHLQRASFEQYQETIGQSSTDSQPSWWTPPREATSEIYLLNTKHGKGRNFAWEITVMAYETNTSNVVYYFLGID